MILAEAIKLGVDPLEWEIISRIHIGPLAISPHGIGIAIGYLVGANVMVRRARRFGGPPESDIWNALFYALIGAIVGARVGYVLGHFSDVTSSGDDLLGIFKVWEGGISLLGGITGAVLFALPYAHRHKMGFWRSTDLAAPALALGIVIGRVGDLMIGDHIGKPTDFFLGWRCLGEFGGAGPVPADVYLQQMRAGDPPSLGCFDLTLHQTALYDFLSTAVLLAVLLYVGRVARRPGLLALIFATWYGLARIATDFLRVDKRYLGLTGSQLLALAVVLACLYLLVRYGGAPPRWADPPGADRGPNGEEVESPTAQSDEEPSEAEVQGRAGDAP